ncbi:MAG: aromatic compounds degradation protein paaI [Elusimicrobia bacterium]|nr:MAG: aromatic compounds degradation protein paaI [Elusimicrobiota bacterium]
MPEELVDVKPFPDKASRKSFTGGALEAERIALRYVTQGRGGALLAQVRFGSGSEGAPKRAHGGAVLTVLDEAMGAACWVKGLPVLTARISAAFRRGVPLEVDLTVETAIVRETPRIIFVTGRLVDGRGGLYAEAEGSFARLRPDQVRATFGDPPSF